MKTIIKALIFIYIIAIPFQRILNTSTFGTKIQFPELVFLALIFFVVVSLIINRNIINKISYNWLDFIGLIWLFPIALSTVFSNFSNPKILEFIGSAYLYILYLILRFYVSKNELINYFRVYILGATIASSLGLIGIVLSHLSFPNDFAYAYVDYPYFGTVYRAFAYTSRPNMLANIITIALILKMALVFDKSRFSLKDFCVVLILGIGLLFTLSKTILVFIIGISLFTILLTFKDKSKPLAYLSWSLIVMLFVGVQFITHFVIVDTNNYSNNKYHSNINTEWSMSVGDKSISIVESSYTINKRASLYAFYEYPIFGLGPGEFNTYVQYLKTIEKYPEIFPNYDPHSTLCGALAELGLLGFICIIFIIYIIFSYRGFLINNNLGIGLLIVFSLALVEAIYTDIMNFRQYWVMLAFTSILIDKGTTTLKSRLTRIS